MDSNFYIFHKKWPALAALGAQAEKNLYQDPHTTKMKVRVFAETLTKCIMAEERIKDTRQKQSIRINMLSNKGIIPIEVTNILHRLRKDANDAHHEYVYSFDLARVLLQSAHELAIWFVTVYGDAQVQSLPFQLPPKENSDAELKRQLDLLSKQYDQHVNKMGSELNQLRKEYLSSEEVRRRRDQSQFAVSRILSPEQIHDLIDSKLRDAQQRQKPAIVNEKSSEKHNRIYKFIATYSLAVFFIMVAIWYSSKNDESLLNNHSDISESSPGTIPILIQTPALTQGEALSQINDSPQDDRSPSATDLETPLDSPISSVPSTMPSSKENSNTISATSSSSESKTPSTTPSSPDNKASSVTTSKAVSITPSTTAPSDSLNNQQIVLDTDIGIPKVNLEKKLAQAINRNSTNEVISLLEEGADPNS
jgi:hypothetical protein